MRYSKEEIDLIKECVELGHTYREIAEFIFEDFDIIRTREALRLKISNLGLNKISELIVDIDKNKCIELINKGYTNEELAIFFKCSVSPIKKFKVTNSIIVPRFWTKIEDNLLIKLAKDFYSAEDVAYKMNKSIGSIHSRSCILGVSFNSNRKKHLDYVKEVGYINKHIKVLGIYNTKRTAIMVSCNICSNIWSPIAANILNSHGCPVCAKLNNPGYYQRLTKERVEALGYPLYLYHAKLQFGAEIFYKFGLTKNEDRSRYKKYQPYKVIEEISFEEHDAWTAICKEKELISNYIPKHHFGGYTECYLKE